MNKVYNTQEEIASEIEKFLKEIFTDIRKTQLNILPYIVLGIILSESVVASDIAKALKNRPCQVWCVNFLNIFLNFTILFINSYNCKC